LSATYLDGLVRYVLSLGPQCKMIAPGRAVDRFRQMASRVLGAHSKGAQAVGAR